MIETNAEANWALRPAQPEDEAFLEALFCRLHAADFAGVPLPEEQIRGLVRMQARAQRLGYLRDFPSARSSIVMTGDSPIGRVLVDAREDVIHLVDIAVLPEWQGTGIGTKLIQDLQAEASGRNLPLHLNVLPQNRALGLYNRLGFQIVSGGLQLGMEWKPTGNSELQRNESESDTTPEPAAKQDVPKDTAAGYTLLIGRSFWPDGASFEVTLDRVQRHPAFGSGSFSLFFFGPVQPTLQQGTHVLHLLTSQSEPEREFAIFLGPLGPAGDRMQYQAVFNL